jgi:hypothetical protein
LMAATLPEAARRTRGRRRCAPSDDAGSCVAIAVWMEGGRSEAASRKIGSPRRLGGRS